MNSEKELCINLRETFSLCVFVAGKNRNTKTGFAEIFFRFHISVCNPDKIMNDNRNRKEILCQKIWNPKV